MLKRTIQALRTRARRARAETFYRHFRVDAQTVILDLGAGTGAHIAGLLEGSAIEPANVHIADIDADKLREGEARFGFSPIVLPETGGLPFPDASFDIVFCSSVIEHVTVPKAQVWDLASGREFRRQAFRRQQEFAAEIRRVGRGYFVQTPNRWFPVESHTWLPLVGYLPRRLQIPLLRISNRIWIKKTSPDWHLLDAADMARLFPDAEIEVERFVGLPKSIMAVKKKDGGSEPLA